MIRFKDGCGESYASADITKKWTATSGSMGSISVVAGAYAGSALQFDGSTTGKMLAIEFGGTEATVGVTYYLKPGTTNKHSVFFTEVNGGIIHLVLDLDQSTGQYTLYRGSRTTQIAQSAVGVITSSIWSSVEVKVNIHDSTGYVEVRVGGVQKLRYDGDTNNGGSYVSRISLGTQDMYTSCTIDHFHIWDTTGSSNNDWMGDVKITTQIMTGDGVTNNWTRSTGAGTHVSHVDDSSPNETDYLSSSTPGNIELFTKPALTAMSVIKDVTVTLYACKDDTGTYNLVGLCRSNGANYESTQQFAMNASWLPYVAVFPVDPDTSAAWLVAAYDAAQLGFKHLS